MKLNKILDALESIPLWVYFVSAIGIGAGIPFYIDLFMWLFGWAWE